MTGRAFLLVSVVAALGAAGCADPAPTSTRVSATPERASASPTTGSTCAHVHPDRFLRLDGGLVPGPDGANANPYLYKITVRRGAVVAAVSAFDGRAGTPPKQGPAGAHILTIICQEQTADAAVAYFRATRTGTAAIWADARGDMSHCTFCQNIAMSIAQVNVT